MNKLSESDIEILRASTRETAKIIVGLQMGIDRMEDRLELMQNTLNDLHTISEVNIAILKGE